MYKLLFFIFYIITIVNCRKDCDDDCDGHHGHHHAYKHNHLLSYFTFLLIKIKTVFVLGTIIALLVISGKLFALIKYFSHYEHHRPKKVYVQEAPNHDYHSHEKIYSPKPNSYKSSPYKTIKYNGRSGKHVDFDETINKFQDMINRLDVTDMTFNSLNIKSEDCRRKFACKANYNSKHNFILAKGMEMFQDQGYDRYGSNNTVNSLEECDQKYPNCKDANV